MANDGTLLTADDGTTITSGIYASEVDNIEGLTINQDGSFEFDPTDSAYNSLSAGDVQEIDITYEVKDFDNLTDENNFSITVSVQMFDCISMIRMQQKMLAKLV